jgi:hypothetical protein
VVHQEAAAVVARQEEPLTTGAVAAHAIRQLERLAVRDASGAAVRKHKPRHRRRRRQAALPCHRAPRPADGSEEGSVSALGEAEEHQAKELWREVRPWWCR